MSLSSYSIVENASLPQALALQVLAHSGRRRIRSDQILVFPKFWPVVGMDERIRDPKLTAENPQDLNKRLFIPTGGITALIVVKQREQILLELKLSRFPSVKVVAIPSFKLGFIRIVKTPNVVTARERTEENGMEAPRQDSQQQPLICDLPLARPEALAVRHTASKVLMARSCFPESRQSPKIEYRRPPAAHQMSKAAVQLLFRRIWRGNRTW